MASLPPSSSTEGISFLAQASATRRPVVTLPVNNTLSGKASIKAWPTSPPPWTTVTRLPGNRASMKSFSISDPHCGVKSLVFETTAFPAAMAGMIWLRGIASG